MTATRSKTDPIQLRSSSIEYHDYFLLMLGLDGEWSRLEAGDGPITAFDRVRRDLERHVRETPYARTVFRFLEATSCEGAPHPRDQELRQLYHPITYLPIGHADLFSLVLLDDFPTVHAITAKIETTIEEICVALVPKKSSLLPERFLAQHVCQEAVPWVGQILDLHEWFRVLRSTDAGRERRPPALAFTRIKLTGTAALALGLPLQEALFRAMSKIAVETLQILDAASRGTLGGLSPAFEIDSAALKNTWIGFVDLLGPEEIGVLVATPNLSIATTLASRLECLTFGDLFAVAEGLQRCFGETEFIRKTFDYYQCFSASAKSMPENRANDAECLKGSHVTRWSRSTVGILPEYVEYLASEGAERGVGSPHPQCLDVRGWVQATTEIRVASGHRDLVDEGLAALLRGETEEGGAKESFPEDVPFRLNALGRADLLLEHALLGYGKPRPGAGSFPHTPSSTLIPFRRLVRRVCRMMNRLTQDARAEHRRDLVGTSSFTSIPVPILMSVRAAGESSPGAPSAQPEDVLFPGIRTNAGRPDRHVGIMEVVLPRLREFLRGSTVGHEDAASPGDPPMERLTLWRGLLSPEELEERARSYGLPEALVNSLQFVYQDFIGVCANPMTFDAVLDLFDGFAALHTTLSQLLPDELRARDGDTRRKGIPVTRRQIGYELAEQISRFLSALDRTMQHRLHQAFPEDLHRDMEADFRGGLQSIQYAADGVLKCGVGVFRRYSLDTERRNRVGVLTRTDFEPGIVNTLLHLGVENRPADGVRLAFVRMDVPHLLHSPSYIDIFHEAMHLIYEHERDIPGSESASTASEDAVPRPLLPTVPRGSPMDEHIDEIFVNLLTVVLTCPEDPDLYKSHFMLQYVSALRWHLPDIAALRSSIANKLIRMFYICEGARFIWENLEKSDVPSSAWQMLFAGEDIEARFKDCAEKATSLLPFTEFFEGAELADRVRADVIRHSTICFHEIHTDLSRYLRMVAKRGHELLSRVLRYVDDLASPGDQSPSQAQSLREGGRKRVQGLMDQVSRLIWHSGGPGSNEDVPWEPRSAPILASEHMLRRECGRFLDPMLLVTQILRHLMEYRTHPFRIQRNAGPPRCIRFDQKLRDFADKEWKPPGHSNEHWLSLTSPTHFCPNPPERGLRLRLWITSMKTLSDVSSNLRATRLSQMLSAAEFCAEDVCQPLTLVRELQKGENGLSVSIRERSKDDSELAQILLRLNTPDSSSPQAHDDLFQLRSQTASLLNRIMLGPSLWKPEGYPGVQFREVTSVAGQRFAAWHANRDHSSPKRCPINVVLLNRAVLQDAYRGML